MRTFWYLREITIFIMVFLVVAPVWSEEVEIQSHKFNRIYDQDLKRHRLVKDTFLIRFADTTPTDKITTLLKTLELVVVSDLGKGVYLCQHSAGTEVSDSYEKFNQIKSIIKAKKNSAIKNFDLNEYHEVELSDDDSAFAEIEWHLDNDGFSGLKKDADINAHEAWGITKGKGVRIAVIDTGVDFSLKNKINFYGKGVNARFVDQSISKETNRSASAPKNSKENHGTAIAGIIAAKHCPGCLQGVAPEVELIPIRLIDDSRIMSTAQMIYAFNKAEELGAQVINCSWGSSSSVLNPENELELSDIEKTLYRELATNANNGKGILVVFASGNSGARDFKLSPQARYEYNFSVGASDSADQITTYSNLAPELDLIAPGGTNERSIITYDRSDQVRFKPDGRKTISVLGYDRGYIAQRFAGTSAASAVVSGVAGLIYAANPTLTANEVKAILISTADPIDCPVEGLCGAGRVNAGKALAVEQAGL